MIPISLCQNGIYVVKLFHFKQVLICFVLNTYEMTAGCGFNSSYFICLSGPLGHVVAAWKLGQFEPAGQHSGMPIKAEIAWEDKHIWLEFAHCVPCVSQARASKLLPDWLNAVNNITTCTGTPAQCAFAFVAWIRRNDPSLTHQLFYLVNWKLGKRRRYLVKFKLVGQCFNVWSYT